MTWCDYLLEICLCGNNYLACFERHSAGDGGPAFLDISVFIFMLGFLTYFIKVTFTNMLQVDLLSLKMQIENILT